MIKCPQLLSDKQKANASDIHQKKADAIAVTEQAMGYHDLLRNLSNEVNSA
jgi:hypothetical protein